MLVLQAVLFGTALAVAAGVCTETYSDEGLLYPHMADNGDTEFVPRLDDGKMALSITGQYKYFKQMYKDQLWVVSNGLLAMTEADVESMFHPYHFFRSETAFIAPLFSDVDIEMADPESSHIWFRETSDPALLQRFKEDMGSYFCKAGSIFKPKYLVILTYQRVESACSHTNTNYYYYYDYDEWLYENYRKKRSAENRDVKGSENLPEEARASLPGNTFQLVLATDNRRRTFAMLNYPSICWDRCWSYNRAGFSDGLGNTYELDKSGTSTFHENTEESNVNKTGRFMFKVDRARLRAPDCSRLYMDHDGYN